MPNEPEDELSEAESRALRAYQAERIPPLELESRVVAALIERGLLSGRQGSAGRWLRATAALAASLLLFLVGAVVGARYVSSPPRPSGEQFVLFLYEGSHFRTAAPGGERKRVREYGEWARRLNQSGHRVTGEKLKEGEQVVGPPASPEGDHGTLGGYFVIDAKNVEEIKRIASTCPHLRYGGWIVIRQIDAV